MFKISAQKQIEINEFLNVHLKEYPEELQKLLQDCLYDGESTYDILMQLYSLKKAIPEELNFYYQFVELLLAKYSHLEAKKIIEVSCGFIPALSIALNHKITRNSPIDVYDPLLIDIDYPNIHNHKTWFTLDNPQDPDLYIANLPCDSLEIIIEKAMQTSKEFMIQTCPCANNQMIKSYAEFKYYIDILFYKMKQMEDKGFIVEKEVTDFSRLSGYPILLARKKSEK